jgi:hypothetical protein
MITGHLCPVCGYEMEDAPKDNNICPSCGTEFGLHDVNASIPELREAWIKSGPIWWSVTDPQPLGWNPFAQLARLALSSATVVTTSAVFEICSGTTNTTAATNSGRVGWGEAAAAWTPSAVGMQFAWGCK